MSNVLRSPEEVRTGLLMIGAGLWFLLGLIAWYRAEQKGKFASNSTTTQGVVMVSYTIGGLASFWLLRQRN